MKPSFEGDVLSRVTTLPDGMPNMKTSHDAAGHDAAGRPRWPGLPVNRPISTPIYQSSAWEFASTSQAEAIAEGAVDGVVYGTRGVPNVVELEQLVGELHGAEAVVATNGGMTALMAVLFAVLEPGDRVLAGRDLFGATVALLELVARWQVEVVYLDAVDLDAMRSEIPGARLLLVETISNPRLRVPDLPALSEIAHRNDCSLMVDNTLATPFHCRPLASGADFVVESVTKALAGHNRVVLGAVAGHTAALEPIRRFVDLTSTAPAPMTAWQAVGGMATFELRQRRAAGNAAEVASWLAGQEQVAVCYPGLESHPDHQVAGRLLKRGFGAIVSFELGVEPAALQSFFDAMDRIPLAMSLGGPVTMATHPWTMTHRWLEPEVRLERGIGPGLVRLSLGVEELPDILGQLAKGLAAVRCRA